MTSAEMRTPKSVFKCGKAENYYDIKVLFKYLYRSQTMPYPTPNWATRKRVAIAIAAQYKFGKILHICTYKVGKTLPYFIFHIL